MEVHTEAFAFKAIETVDSRDELLSRNDVLFFTDTEHIVPAVSKVSVGKAAS